MLYLACIKHVLTFSHVLTTNHILTSTTGLDNLNYTGGAFDLYGFHVTSSNGVLYISALPMHDVIHALLVSNFKLLCICIESTNQYTHAAAAYM